MDFQELFNAALGLAFIFIGWFLRAVWDAVNALRDDLKELERNLPDTYVRRDDYHADVAEIKAMLVRIADKLEHKVDKDHLHRH
jgi:hypothetical protein